VVAADADAVEVADLLLDEVLLHIAHQAQRELGAEDAGVLRLVFLEDVGLHRAADLFVCLEGLGVPRLKSSRVACSTVAGLVRASIHGVAGSSFVGLLAARGCKALPAPGCHFARSRSSHT
jgi:hypothetical protein